MTAPAMLPTQRPPTVVNNSSSTPPPKSSPFGAAAPPDKRTTALNSAVAIMRGKSPTPQAQEVLAMAEQFYQFLKQGN